MERYGIAFGWLHLDQIVTREVRKSACNRSLDFEDMEAEMPRYFFHLRSDDNFVWDDEGVDLPDPLTAQGAADKTAAELWGGLLHQVHRDCCWTMIITDEGGEIVQVKAL